MTITLSTCFYVVRSKFPPQTYIQWMAQFFFIVREFNLVVYTDELSSSFLPSNVHNPRIRVVIRPIEQFTTYKYKQEWIANQQIGASTIPWQLNMLWNEKAFFVQETVRNKYFPASFYGWCDIGYFRNRIGRDMPLKKLLRWGSAEKISRIDMTKINYGCVERDFRYIDYLYNRSSTGAFYPIPATRPVVSGGFFIAPSSEIGWWTDVYESTLKQYFENNAFIKDDQTIIASAIFTHPEKFMFHREFSPPYDHWFLFQRIFQ